MSTRGALVFVLDGTEKTTYNHSDSYPEGLGEDVLTWLRGVVAVELGIETLRESVRALRVVDPNSTPTEAEIARITALTPPNLRVSTNGEDDWYCLLRNTQGDPAEILRIGVIEDADGFPLESLHCEWAYVVDLDANVFEIHKGFQDRAHSKGRFAKRGGEARGGYFPVALVASYPLDALPATGTLGKLDPDD